VRLCLRSPPRHRCDHLPQPSRISEDELRAEPYWRETSLQNNFSHEAFSRSCSSRGCPGSASCAGRWISWCVFYFDPWALDSSEPRRRGHNSAHRRVAIPPSRVCGYLRQLEQGTKSPTLRTLTHLAEAFGVPVSTLIKRAERRISFRK